MYPDDICFTEERRIELLTKNRQIDFRSNINVFLNHNGIRRGKMHLFIAPTGVGKSTFVRTMVVDFIKNNPKKKMLIWLTEESREDFMEEVANCLPAHEKIKDIVQVITEQHLDEDSDSKKTKKDIEEIVSHFEYDLLVVDNITTSYLYETSPTEQGKVARWLKSLCKNDVAVFVIAHTGGQIQESSNKLLDENDIRGSKILCNLTEFLYILQPFFVGNALRQFVITKKHRGQELKSKYIKLEYNKDLRIFQEQNFVEFDVMKKIFQLRNKLSDK